METLTEQIAHMSYVHCSEEQMDYALGVVPPIFVGNGFLMGEPESHRVCSVTKEIHPTYCGYFKEFGVPCVTKKPHTKHEFLKLLQTLKN